MKCPKAFLSTERDQHEKIYISKIHIGWISDKFTVSMANILNALPTLNIINWIELIEQNEK